MVVIEPPMNMSQKLIFLGRGLQNIGAMTNVGPIENNTNRYPELINMMNSIERRMAEEFEESIVQEIRSLNIGILILVQRSCSTIVNSVIDLYSRVI